MATINLCTYTRSFYPYIWQYKYRTVMAAFVVISDGKILKKSFKECYYYSSDYPAEVESFENGLSWVVANVDDLRDVNLQVFFCGSGKVDVMKTIENGSFFIKCTDRMGGSEFGVTHTISNLDLLKMFNKVTYHTANRILVKSDEDFDDDDFSKPSKKFDVYESISKLFALLYGDDVNAGHRVIEDVRDPKTNVIRKVLVGIPELRWAGGAPDTQWT